MYIWCRGNRHLVTRVLCRTKRQIQWIRLSISLQKDCVRVIVSQQRATSTKHIFVNTPVTHHSEIDKGTTLIQNWITNSKIEVSRGPQSRGVLRPSPGLEKKFIIFKFGPATRDPRNATSTWPLTSLLSRGFLQQPFALVLRVVLDRPWFLRACFVVWLGLPLKGNSARFRKI